MLTQLSIRNLAVVEQLDLNFPPGMLVITGETGAGKSIIIDALSLVLGERASTNIIRSKHSFAEITACFDIKRLPKIKNWLQEYDLDAFDECIIRRVIKKDGPSRAYVNGHIVPITQLKALGENFVQIHSQHQHHSLLNSEHQRQLIDEYAGHTALLQEVTKYYQQWSALRREIENLTKLKQNSEKIKLLNYQIQEIEDLGLEHNELQILEKEHRQLAKAEELLSKCQEAANLISHETEYNIQSKMHLVVNYLQNLQQTIPELTNCQELLQQALIQITEANEEITNYLERIDLSPEKLATVEMRLSKIHELARKHRIAPEFISEHYEALKKEKNLLENANEELDKLQFELETALHNYKTSAHKLTASRRNTANDLSDAICERLKTLELPHAQFAIQVESGKFISPLVAGLDTVIFMVSTNPGQNLGPLKAIASGGELSRISLAIQVIFAEKLTPPTLIFDEVDVGINGKTAQVVGNLMRQLGTNNQIICITHLPQVAACGHTHYKVTKLQSSQITKSNVNMLSAKQKIEELARMMGGKEVTPQALAHAKILIKEIN